MNRLIPVLAAACFSLAAVSALAQAPAGDAGKGPMEHRGMMMKPCSQEADPVKCETNRKAMHENMKSAHEACKDKPDRRACMTEQMCSKSADQAACKAKAKERGEKMSKRMDEHQKAAEACTGKRGDELMKCMHEQHEKSGRGRSDKKG